MNNGVDWGRWRAVLFDLDGVLTDTARLHARAWKVTFDELLAESYPDQPEFSIETDYLTFVDGRPRYDGVATFLASRSIALPWGSPSDPPEPNTVCGVGNRKNELVGVLIETEGVEVYPGSQRLVDYLIQRGMPMAVVTSSANAGKVLAGAGLDAHFDVRVDGEVAAQLGLRGKPNPDPFLQASKMLRVPPGEAVVVEDATSGVAAGRAGAFGLVIGVDRGLDPEALLAAGADLVTDDLGALVP